MPAGSSLNCKVRCRSWALLGVDLSLLVQWWLTNDCFFSGRKEYGREGKENNQEVFKNKDKRRIAKTEDKGEEEGPDEPGVCHLSSSGRLAHPDQSLRSMYYIEKGQSTMLSLFSLRRKPQSSVHCCVYSWVHNTNRTCRKRTAP